jgi:NADH dehydrogenase/NADH:ubiquinone oxidoreductase subunit G
LTNESVYTLRKFAKEVVETENFAVADAFSVAPFFRNLGGQLATHRDIRFARTIVLIGGEPEELQPLTGKQIRQAVRNGGANLIIFNSAPIRLREQASRFIHINRGSENAAVLGLLESASADRAAKKMGIESAELEAVRKTINDSQGDVVIMFGGELSAATQTIVAQFPYLLAGEGRRVLLHPLPLFNNSVGAHDMAQGEAQSASELLDRAGQDIRAAYIAGSLLLSDDASALSRLDFVVVQELFENDTTAYVDVVFPAASFAEVDGTFTNNGGLVQRVRQSIEPVHQSMADWMIAARIAKELGVDFGFERSASAVFREIAERLPAYEGLRYPVLKDESQPLQVKHAIAAQRDLKDEIDAMRREVEALSDSGAKTTETPAVGHELFKPGTLMSKTPQMQLLAAGNPEPESFLISPLYQITVDESLKRELATA